MFAFNQVPMRYNRSDIRLYRDYGLAVFRGMSGSVAEHAKKDITKSFDDLSLRITIQSNLEIVNFLDVTLILRYRKCYPYCKLNNRPLYINRLSNHLPSILKHIPAAISTRLTNISHYVEVFKEAASLYSNGLRDSGFVNNVEYIESRKVKEPGPKLSQMIMITWFNTPYTKNVATRIGQKFLRLIDRHFPVGSKLHNIPYFLE